jgi:hypothetical protein
MCNISALKSFSLALSDDILCVIYTQVMRTTPHPI